MRWWEVSTEFNSAVKAINNTTLSKRTNEAKGGGELVPAWFVSLGQFTLKTSADQNLQCF